MEKSTKSRKKFTGRGKIGGQIQQKPQTKHQEEGSSPGSASDLKHNVEKFILPLCVSSDGLLGSFPTLQECMTPSLKFLSQWPRLSAPAPQKAEVQHELDMLSCTSARAICT